MTDRIINAQSTLETGALATRRKMLEVLFGSCCQLLTAASLPFPYAAAVCLFWANEYMFVISEGGLTVAKV